MARSSVKVHHIPSAIQGIRSSTRIQEQYCSIPAIKITHVFEEPKIFPTKSINEQSVQNAVTLKKEIKPREAKMSKVRTCVQCNSNGSQKFPCVDNCLSLMLPLEVELNVLGVVEQGMIDRGEIAKIRRVGKNKRNSAPDIPTHETLRIETPKSRPRSFTSGSDHKLVVALLESKSLQSTTLCSTEL